MLDSGDRPIVEIEVGNLDIFTEGLRFDRKSMILTGDFYRASQSCGLVESSVAEFEFKCFRPQGQAQNLMSHTDAENRLVGI